MSAAVKGLCVCCTLRAQTHIYATQAFKLLVLKAANIDLTRGKGMEVVNTHFPGLEDHGWRYLVLCFCVVHKANKQLKVRMHMVFFF